MAAFVVFTIHHPQGHVEALLMYLDAGAFALATSLSLSLSISRYCGLRSCGELQAWPNFFRQTLLFFVHVGRNGEARASVFVDAAETIAPVCGPIQPIGHPWGTVSGENASGATVQEGQALVESVLTWDVEKKCRSCQS